MEYRRRFQVWLAVCLVSFPVTTGAGWADSPAKLDRTCGCKAGSYAVYGAGNESCAVYLTERSRNPDEHAIDAGFGQSLGWIAGYMSAANRAADARDVYDMDLSYVAHRIGVWCEEHPDKTLSDALDALTTERGNNSSLLPVE